MRAKHLLKFLVLICLLNSCGDKQHHFVIIGNIAKIPDQKIVLEQISANEIITIIDSVHPNQEGHFEFTALTTEPGLYRLHFTNSKFILLSLDKENVKVIADWNSIEKYNVVGSPASESLRALIALYRDKMKDFHTMSIVLDTLKAKGNDSLFDVAKKDVADMNLQFTHQIESYADTTPYLPNAVFAARMLNPSSEINFLDEFTQNLSRRFPGTKMAKDFAEYFFAVNDRTSKNSAKTVNIKIGDMAPEITLPDMDGKIIALSSLRGKYVLVDFWASFCPPCRAENPNIVKVYNSFKGKNFEIYGVSLDDNKSDWKKAIGDDNISWIQVSDLKRWESVAAKSYGVEAIPTNFLVDPSGKIIGRDLMGEQLEEKLRSLVQ